MQSNIYVSLSAQAALLKRLESVAQNIANVSTPGYRAERISFQELVSQETVRPTSFVAPGRTFLSTVSGALEKTGNPLDIAVNGDAWLGLATPAGMAYTRDGRFRMTPDGELQSVQGFRLVDIGGSPLQIDPNGPAPSIAKDGTLSQAGRTVGTIGLFSIPADATLKRFANGSVVPDRAAGPQLDFNAVAITQGFLERSNVEPVLEMTRLIAIQRRFDALTNAVADVESGLENAIRTLGG